ncbi:MAG TPA: (d)CMP kinase [Candidatus Binatia bacterium]|nr:(d)CMP kinase [Candidatus Binatia bacterium]
MPKREDIRCRTGETRLIVAIDGPSGAGKSTLAKRVAQDLGFIYLDTGAMYRALALKVLQQGLKLEEEARLAALVQATEIDLSERSGRLEVLLDGVDVSDRIRTPEVSQMASKISALNIVRQRMLDLQRALGSRGDVVAEGRDIGTVVFPEAEVKIYLDASVGERARRRFEELRKAGRPTSLEETRREMEERDKRDRGRDLAPLRQADDALAIDSSSLDADTVAERVKQIIRRKSIEN